MIGATLILFCRATIVPMLTLLMPAFGSFEVEESTIKIRTLGLRIVISTHPVDQTPPLIIFESRDTASGAPGIPDFVKKSDHASRFVAIIA